MVKRSLILIGFVFLLFLIPGSALAQDYYFRMDREVVDVFFNDDGTTSIYYNLEFYNDPSGHSIEYVDLGLPNYTFNTNNIQAQVNGVPVAYISSSEFEGSGSGVAIALGNQAIPPGQSGTLEVSVVGIKDLFFVDDENNDYASAVFAPNYFKKSYVYGSTNITVTFHLPPGVKPEEPRWHNAPKGFPEEPDAGHDTQGRITYTWRNASANPYSEYKFGASFPAVYVPVSSVAKPTLSDRTGINADTIMGFLCCGSVGGFIALIAWLGITSEKRRKMKYLPPKIRIEGHGIKRGLTSVEAAILMEQPMDKIMTMILFSVIKKGAARVISKDPLQIETLTIDTEKLRSYETKFLEAFQETKSAMRRNKLQDMMVGLIKSVGTKMKGFSHKETVAYYQSIMERAWQQVESAETPEVKMDKFDEHLGWTMLDKDFDEHTQDVFRTGPVFVPMWWGRYDPTWSSSATPGTSKVSTAKPSIGGGRSAPSLPNLPGGEFAASVVGGIQGFSKDVVGNVTDFTSKITNKTNPVPKTSTRSGGWSSGGGGSSCACACACAGCACACAGGGR